MGWIKRNWFWYTHHDLWIEPTEEQKEQARIIRKRARKKFGMFMATAMVLNESIK